MVKKSRRGFARRGLALFRLGSAIGYRHQETFRLLHGADERRNAPGF